MAGYQLVPSGEKAGKHFPSVTPASSAGLTQRQGQEGALELLSLLALVAPRAGSGARAAAACSLLVSGLSGRFMVRGCNFSSLPKVTGYWPELGSAAQGRLHFINEFTFS